MKPKTRRVGQVRKAIAWVQLHNKHIIRSGDLKQALGLTAKQEVDLLTYLRRKGFFVQITRGLYLAPTKLPPGGWVPSPYKALNILMRELNAKYQITGLYAFNRYGLSSQVPMLMTVYNTVLSGEKIVGKSRFQFIKVKSSRIGATKTIEIPNDGIEEAFSVPISSLARTLFDAVYDYKRFATLPEAYEWIKTYKNNKKLMKLFVNVTIQYGNIGSKRRIGFILSKFGITKAWLDKLWKTLPRTSSLLPLVPDRKAAGSIDKKWRIIINEQI